MAEKKKFEASLGVEEVIKGVMVTNIEQSVTVKDGDKSDVLAAKNRARGRRRQGQQPLAGKLATRAHQKSESDRSGRIKVNRELTHSQFSEIFSSWARILPHAVTMGRRSAAAWL